MKSTKGYWVDVKETGKRGRTFHRKGMVGDQMPVYPEGTTLNEAGEAMLDEGHGPLPATPEYFTLKELEIVGPAE